MEQGDEIERKRSWRFHKLCGKGWRWSFTGDQAVDKAVAKVSCCNGWRQTWYR